MMVGTESLISGLKRNAPQILQEWTGAGLIERKKARRRLTEKGVYAPTNNVVRIGIHTIPHINLFSLKFLKSSYFEITKNIISSNHMLWASWYTKEDIQQARIPDEFKNMLGDSRWLQQGRWSTRRHFEYRHATGEHGTFAILARFNMSLIVAGLALTNPDNLPIGQGWMSPNEADARAVIGKRIGYGKSTHTE